MQVHRRGSAYGRVSCAYQSAGTEYVRKHAGGGENRAQPQEQRRWLPPYGAKPPHAGTREPARVWLRWMARVHYRVAREKGVQPDSACAERARGEESERERERKREKERGGETSEREREIARVARRRTRWLGEANEESVGGKAGERRGGGGGGPRVVPVVEVDGGKAAVAAAVANIKSLAHAWCIHYGGMCPCSVHVDLHPRHPLALCRCHPWPQSRSAANSVHTPLRWSSLADFFALFLTAP